MTIGLRDQVRDLWRALGRWAAPISPSWAAPPPVTRFNRVLLTEGVADSIFREYSGHHRSRRGQEEIGWSLVGIRQGDAAIVLASIPAGEARDAGHDHVRFDPIVQSVACRVVRQRSRTLTVLGVLHTHPGSLRHPSSADYRGDIEWVKNLREAEGVFGIGVIEPQEEDTDPGADGAAGIPVEHALRRGDLTICWYALAAGDRNYRPLPVGTIAGPDLAGPLRDVWPELEFHAERIERLAAQLRRVDVDVAAGLEKPALTIQIPLGWDRRTVMVELEGKGVRYRVVSADTSFAAELPEPRIDVGVYLLLSDIAAEDLPAD